MTTTDIQCRFTELVSDWCAHCQRHELENGTPLTGDETAPWLELGAEGDLS